MLNVVLVAPEIPQNTGNIARTCAQPAPCCILSGRWASISPSGPCAAPGSITGIWSMCAYTTISGTSMRKTTLPSSGCSLASTRSYCDVSYDDGCYLFFGRETKGLPEPFLEAHYDDCVRIPIREEARSLNLSNSVAIGVFEALRQLNFPHLRDYGKMKV